FVGSIEKHLAAELLAIERGHRCDASRFDFHTALAIEPRIAHDGNLVLGDPILKDLLGDVRLKDPHRALLAVDSGRPLPFVAIFSALLPAPGGGGLIVLPNAMIKLARQAADDRLVAGIG